MNRPQLVATYCGGAVAILGLGVAIGFAINDAATGDGWGTEQVGPLATWVAGLLTLAAVGLAFYQNYESRKNLTEERARNKQDKADAEARHNQQIALAEKQLEAQLQARKIERQTDALVQIVDHLEIVTIESSAYLIASRGPNDHSAGIGSADRAIEWSKNMHSRLSQVRMLVPSIYESSILEAGSQYIVAVQDLVRLPDYEGIAPEQMLASVGDRVIKIDAARKEFDRTVLSRQVAVAEL